MREVSGRMRFGRNSALSVELNYNFEELALTLGYWDVAMGVHVEFTIAPLKISCGGAKMPEYHVS